MSSAVLLTGGNNSLVFEQKNKFGQGFTKKHMWIAWYIMNRARISSWPLKEKNKSKVGRAKRCAQDDVAGELLLL